MKLAVRINRADRLTPNEVAEVLALAQAAAASDGVYPLSEHIVLHLRYGGEAPAVHLLAWVGSELIGYAHIDPTDLVEGPAAELVVHPGHRRQGAGRALVRAAMAAADERAGRPTRIRLWAHGDNPAAVALARSLGFERWRVLWQMRRSLALPVPEPRLPEGVRLRPFRPGRDDEAWLRVNARAFAGHPEQGKWTLDDLRIRLAEPWFDANGFLLAERESDGELVGFHWTKVHGSSTVDHAHRPIGEVYVLGVDPQAQGTGLGSALTLAGLRYLRDHGLTEAMLYVDESNTSAIALYTKLGFTRWSTDVSFRRLV